MTPETIGNALQRYAEINGAAYTEREERGTVYYAIRPRGSNTAAVIHLSAGVILARRGYLIAKALNVEDLFSWLDDVLSRRG